MKKLISLLAALAVVTTGTVAFAAETTTEVEMDSYVNESTPISLKEGSEDVYSVTATTTADQATILAIKGKTIKVGAIQYINQATTAAVADSETDKSATFEFSLNSDLLTAATTAGITDTKVYVLTGGDGSVTGVGYIETAASSDPETFTISGTVSNVAGAKNTVVVTVTDGTNNYPAAVDADGNFSIAVPVLASGSYTLTATKTSHLSYTMTGIAETTKDAVATVNPVVRSGDIDKTGQADVLDIGEIVNVFNSTTNSANFKAECDLDESGQCDVLDIGEIVNNFNKQNVTATYGAE